MKHKRALTGLSDETYRLALSLFLTFHAEDVWVTADDFLFLPPRDRRRFVLLARRFRRTSKAMKARAR